MTAISRRLGVGALASALTISVACIASSDIAQSVPTRNADPTAKVKVGKPSGGKGTVRIIVRAKDSDSRHLHIHAPTRTDKGRVTTVTSRDGEATGVFNYTPTPSARHAAASDDADASATTDTFTITVTDGYGGTVAVPVTVQVRPQNSPPVAGAPTVGAPDPVTGVVTGQVNAVDPDGDPLTYLTSTPPTTGTVTVNPRTGGFTYTPTAVAPTLREVVVENPVTITFTVTITDGYGGSVAVPVNAP